MHIEVLAQRPAASPPIFTAREVLSLIATMWPVSEELNYLRPVLGFLTRLTNAGILTERPSRSSAPEDRAFQGNNLSTLAEYTLGLPVAAFGLPYVAHAYGDVTVRVHAKRCGEECIATGIIVTRDCVVTNEHVVREATEIAVSWGDSGLVSAKRCLPHPDPERFDLAIVEAPGFHNNPPVFVRPPRTAESVVTLGYPMIPQVPNRPLLRFVGNVATDEPVKSYFGVEQMILCAVMSPGASGAPIFAGDGYLVGLVVRRLEGKYIGAEGAQSESIFHAAIPGDVLLRELPKIDRKMHLLNRFLSEEEAKELVENPRATP